MSDEDLKKIGQIVDEKIVASEQRLEEKLDQNFGQKLIAFESKLEQRLDQKLSTFESKLEQRLDQRITESEQRVIAEVGKFIEESILPAIEEKATSAEVNRLQNSVDKIGDRVIALEGRVDKLEGKSPVTPPAA